MLGRMANMLVTGDYQTGHPVFTIVLIILGPSLIFYLLSPILFILLENRITGIIGMLLPFALTFIGLIRHLIRKYSGKHLGEEND